MPAAVRKLASKLPLTWLKNLGTFAIIAVCLTLLWERAQEIDLQMLQSAFAQTGILQWIGALGATCVSYVAFGRYEAHWHIIRNTGVPPARARQIGMAAAAAGQTFGFGAVTGSIVRLKVMGRNDLTKTLGLSAAISLSFMVCLALIATPLAAFAGIAVSPLLWLVIAVGAAVIGLNLPRMRASVWTAIGPRAALSLLGLTVIDVTAMGVAFYVLLPATVDIGPAVVIAAFAIALGAGLLSNAPGGLGAFDLTLCMLLATVGDSTVIMTLLAFRMVNHLIPAVLALAWVFLARHRDTGQDLPHFAPADWGMHRQGAQITQTGRVLWLTRMAFGLRIAIGSGFGANPVDQINAARGRRRGDTNVAALYKVPGQTALAARNAGWLVRRIASDAVIDLANWDMGTPARKRLRRNVRQAEKAGVTVTFDVVPSDWPRLEQVATLWAREHGGELGFSMGRFDRAYLADQAICVIRHENRIIGFLSLHRSALDWSLDLIRQVPDIPEGTMHLAICAAIAKAQAAGARQVSLGAVPFARPGDKVGVYIAEKRAGLIRFKSCFRPRWVPLYFAAPNSFLFVISACAVLYAVQRPLERAIWRARASRPAGLAQTHEDHASFSIEPASATWQAMTDTPQGQRPL